jgi:hypothetical protein
LDPGPFIAEIITIIGYLMIFVGVYKIFQISSTLGEIKELLKSQRGFVSSGPAGPLPSDPADAYAENLLRAVNQESHQVDAAPTRD